MSAPEFERPTGVEPTRPPADGNRSAVSGALAGSLLGLAFGTALGSNKDAPWVPIAFFGLSGLLIGACVSGLLGKVRRPAAGAVQSPLPQPGPRVVRWLLSGGAAGAVLWGLMTVADRYAMRSEPTSVIEWFPVVGAAMSLGGLAGSLLGVGVGLLAVAVYRRGGYGTGGLRRRTLICAILGGVLGASEGFVAWASFVRWTSPTFFRIDAAAGRSAAYYELPPSAARQWAMAVIYWTGDGDKWLTIGGAVVGVLFGMACAWAASRRKARELHA